MHGSHFQSRSRRIERLDRKQAIEIFKSRLEISDYEKQIPEYYQAMRMAVEALKKQIPEIPAYEGDGYDPEGNIIFDEWLCPCCGTRYEVDYDEHDFCPNCGQAIDRRECSEEE